MISYKGIDEAVLIHALYENAYRPGMGSSMTPAALIDIASSIAGAVTVDVVRSEFGDFLRRDIINIDYYKGRPIKVNLDTKAKEFDPRLFDRDAGRGRAADVVGRLMASVPREDHAAAT